MSLQPRQIDRNKEDGAINTLSASALHPLSADTRLIPLDKSHTGGGHDPLSNFITALGAGGAVLALTPSIIHKIADITGNHRTSHILKEYSGKCCPVIKKQGDMQGTSWAKDKYGDPTYGIAGTLSAGLAPIPGRIEDLLGIGQIVEKALDSVPGILGHTLKRDEVKLAMIGGGITLVSHAAGNFIGRMNQRLGRFTQRAMQLVGLTCMLPAVLPGVGHFVLTSSALLGIDDVDFKKAEAHGPGVAIAALLGKAPGDCWLEEGKAASGAVGGGFMALCCALPVVIGVLPSLIGSMAGNNKNTVHSSGHNR